MRRLLPEPAADLDLAGLAAHYAYPAHGAVRANMVSSLDGAVTVEGSSRGLSGQADRLVFAVLRALCDVVLVGAGTARTEDYRPPKVTAELAPVRPSGRPAPVLAVVTRSGRLDPGARMFADPTNRTLVLTCEAADRARLAALDEVAEVVVAGDADVDPKTALAELTGRGLGRVLTEGGPSLLGTLASADLLDELALSLAPLVVGGDAGRIVGSPTEQRSDWRPHGLLQSGSTVFAHYVRERS
jgi:riboflavin-specific deaminase-like protein